MPRPRRELRGRTTAFYLGKDKKSSSSQTRPAFVKNCVKTKKKISAGNPADFCMHAHQTATNLVRVNLKTLQRFLNPGLGRKYPQPLSQTLLGAPHTLGYLKTKPQERSNVFCVFGVFLHCTESDSHD